ncbi:MAG: hypothetical protein GZ087_14705 [Flavobacterium sp.]|nr:hypothetical protein [Flavobacterium sp.]
MKNSLLLLFVISVQLSVAQTNTIVSSKSSTLPPIQSGVCVVSGTVNAKPTKILSIIFDGNIEEFINKMKLSLGNAEITTEGKFVNSIIFKNFKKPEWSEDKIILTFSSTTNLGRNAVVVTCFDSTGNDLLELESKSNMKIKTYFESLLPK